MKIIQKGIPETAKEYHYSCTHCRCIFRAKKEEHSLDYDWRNGIFWTINCPQEGCGKVLYRYDWTE